MPSYPRSKNIVLVEQVFGRTKVVSSPPLVATPDKVSGIPKIPSGVAPRFPSKHEFPPLSSRHTTRNTTPTNGAKDKGKRHMDEDRFNIVTSKKGLGKQ